MIHILNKEMIYLYKNTFLVPYVSIAVITRRPAIRLEHCSNWLIGGNAIIIHDADPTLFFGDHDNESQEA